MTFYSRLLRSATRSSSSMLETLTVPGDSLDSVERCNQVRHQLL